MKTPRDRAIRVPVNTMMELIIPPPQKALDGFTVKMVATPWPWMGTLIL
jgi:hypothetical protein